MGVRSIISIPTHPLTADNISQPTKQELSDQGTNRCSNLDAEILIDIELATCEDDERTNRRTLGDVGNSPAP